MVAKVSIVTGDLTSSLPWIQHEQNANEIHLTIHDDNYLATSVVLVMPFTFSFSFS